MYRGSAYILLGRWIDAYNDHMYVENLAVDEKQCPPFCQRFGGVYPFLSSALIVYPDDGVDIGSCTKEVSVVFCTSDDRFRHQVMPVCRAYILIYMLGCGYAELPIVLLYLCRSLVCYMLPETRRDSRSLYNDT